MIFQCIIHNGDNMPYNITEEKKQQIIESNDIVDVIEEFLPLKKSGTNYSACCPFHQEKTPSFVVSKDKQIYHCFGCGKSGDVINFLMDYRNLTYIESIEYLADRAHINLEKIKYSKEAIEKNELENRLYQINKEAAYYFHANITRSKDALDYLSKRAIDKNIIKRFGIGYTVNEWDNLLRYLKNKGYTENEILKTGLIIKSEKAEKCYDRFRNRIIFPIVDIHKRIIGFGGRVLDDSTPKYLNSPDSLIFNKGNNLYGLNIAKENVRNKSFILVEGYMDVIKMHVYGYNTTVAALGTSLTDNQVKLLKRYSNSFYLCFDSDDAGLKAAQRAINMFKKNNLDAKVIIIEGAKDPDEFLNKYGKTKFDMLIEKALGYYDFLEFYYKKDLNPRNIMDYINNIFDNLVNVNSEIEKELIIDKLSFKVGISKDSLMSEFRKKYKRKSNNTSIIKKENSTLKTLTIQKSNINNLHEEELIKLILKNNNLALQLKQIIEDEDFTDYEFSNLFKSFYQSTNQGVKITKDYLNTFEGLNINYENVFKELDVTEHESELLFYDCYKRLKIKYLEGIYSNLKKELTKINDEAVQKQNMQNIMRLAKKIKSLKEEVF